MFYVKEARYLSDGEFETKKEAQEFADNMTDWYPENSYIVEGQPNESEE